MKAAKKNFADIAVGDGASFEKVISEEDVATFAEVSGDHNPLHADEAYASSTEFKRKVVHGMFLGALVSRLVGMELPGESALLLTVSLTFKKPAYVGDTLRVVGSVTHKSETTRVVELGVEIFRADELLVAGSAQVRVRE